MSFELAQVAGRRREALLAACTTQLQGIARDAATGRRCVGLVCERASRDVSRYQTVAIAQGEFPTDAATTPNALPPSQRISASQHRNLGFSLFLDSPSLPPLITIHNGRGIRPKT